MWCLVRLLFFYVLLVMPYVLSVMTYALWVMTYALCITPYVLRATQPKPTRINLVPRSWHGWLARFLAVERAWVCGII